MAFNFQPIWRPAIVPNRVVVNRPVVRPKVITKPTVKTATTFSTNSLGGYRSKDPLAPTSSGAVKIGSPNPLSVGGGLNVRGNSSSLIKPTVSSPGNINAAQLLADSKAKSNAQAASVAAEQKRKEDLLAKAARESERKLNEAKEGARLEAERKRAAEEARIKALWDNYNSELAKRRNFVGESARNVRRSNKQSEASQFLVAPKDVVGETDETARIRQASRFKVQKGFANAAKFRRG